MDRQISEQDIHIARAFVDDALRKAGIDENSSPQERLRVLQDLYDEATNSGLVPLPNGKRTYIGAGTSSDSEKNFAKGLTQAAKEKISGDAPEIQERNKQIVTTVAIMLVAVLLLFIPRMMRGKNASPSNTQEVTAVSQTVVPSETEEPTDYGVLISSLEGNSISSYDAPSSITFNNNNFVVARSNKKLLSSGAIWCNIYDSDNIGCWLSGSTINTVIGMGYNTYEKYWKDAQIGDTIEVGYGTRKNTYVITEIKEVEYTDTTIYRMKRPTLTLLFFGQRDKDNIDLVVSSKRKVIVAEPKQQIDKQYITETTSNVVTYTGIGTPINVEGNEATITAKVFNANPNDDSYLKVVFYLNSDQEDINFGVYNYSLGVSDLEYSPTNQGVDGDGMYDVTFIVKNSFNNVNTIPYVFTIMVDGGDDLQVVGSITPPSTYQHLAILTDGVRANYNTTTKELNITVDYSLDLDSPPVTCNECSLSVAGDTILPQEQVIFYPDKNGSVMIKFIVDINSSNINSIKLTIADNVYSLSPSNE